MNAHVRLAHPDQNDGGIWAVPPGVRPGEHVGQALFA